MAGIKIRRFEQADETRKFEHGSFELVTIGGITIGRASYEPGWIWSEHVGKPAGEALCQVEHVGLVVSGRTGRPGSSRKAGSGSTLGSEARTKTSS